MSYILGNPAGQLPGFDSTPVVPALGYQGIRPKRDGKSLTSPASNYIATGDRKLATKVGRDLGKTTEGNGRIQPQRTGLATETDAAFHKALLKTIKKEPSSGVRLVLSLWRPKKETPGRTQMAWERWWQKALESDRKAISQTAALALLRPNPADDLVARRQKLQNALRILPEKPCPEMSIAEITYLVGEVGLGKGGVDVSQAWQFKSDGMRFHVPTERTAPSSIQVTVPTGMPDGTVQKNRHK